MDNQHYTPRAHLDRFVHPESDASGNRVLYPFVKGRGRGRPRGPKRLASCDSFYSQTLADGSHDNSLDEAIQELERMVFASGRGFSGPLARCVFEGKLPRTTSDRLDLIGAVVFMRCRSPVQIHNCAMMGDLANQADFFNYLNSDEAKAALLDDGLDEAAVAATLERDREDLLDGVLTVERDDLRTEGFESFHYANLMGESLAQMRIRLVHCYRDDVFVTSDNPVVIHVPGHPTGQGILQSRDTEIWFPISHDRGLLLDHRSGDDAIDLAGHSQSIALNRRMIKWCYRSVYSPLPLDWLDAATRTESFNPLLGRMKTLREFIDSGTGNVVSFMDYLESAPDCDVFAGMKL